MIFRSHHTLFSGTLHVLCSFFATDIYDLIVEICIMHMLNRLFGFELGRRFIQSIDFVLIELKSIRIV